MIRVRPVLGVEVHERLDVAAGVRAQHVRPPPLGRPVAEQRLPATELGVAGERRLGIVVVVVVGAGEQTVGAEQPHLAVAALVCGDRLVGALARIGCAHDDHALVAGEDIVHLDADVGRDLEQRATDPLVRLASLGAAGRDRPMVGVDDVV